MKLLTDNINIGIATLKSIRDPVKRERVSFKCNKDYDYSFIIV